MKNKTIIIYALTVLFILVMWWIFVTYASNKQEPIQKILNQIEANESELQQLEIKQAELNQATQQAKEELLNKYGLQLSESEKTEDLERCNRAYEQSVKMIMDWVSTADYQWEIMKEEWWCNESFKSRLEEIWKERTPWKLNESGDAQEMPEIQATDEHERFKELATAYWLDASTIREVENHYWIKEWVILCITVAETSGGNRGYGEKNIWSVWSNDRGDRPTYALMEAWLEAIGKTLNNQYLWSKKTLWCLSNAWSCTEKSDNWKRYATSESSREKNMVACLSTIYWSINASEFGIRR